MSARYSHAAPRELGFFSSGGIYKHAAPPELREPVADGFGEVATRPEPETGGVALGTGLRT